MEELVDFNLDIELQELTDKHHQELSTAFIEKIPNTHVYTNSINIAVGKQRSGKTYTIIKEIIKISRNCKNTHLLIYSNKTGDETDKTFENLKLKIEIPIIYISHNKLDEYLQNFLLYKQLYNEILKNEYMDRQDDEQKNTMFETLHIKDFSRPYLHTLILLEDVAQAKILKNKKTYIQELMTQCAHINCSFFLAVQFWSSLTTNIKEQVSVIFAFGGYCRSKFMYMFNQIATEIDKEEIWYMYRNLGDKEKLIIDSRNGDII